MDGGSRSSNTKLSSTHKVGYDPRDMETEDEEKLHPLLTLMEEVLLLGLKDKQVRLLSIHCQVKTASPTSSTDASVCFIPRTHNADL